MLPDEEDLELIHSRDYEVKVYRLSEEALLVRGAELWRAVTGHSVRGTPAVSGQRVVFGDPVTGCDLCQLRHMASTPAGGQEPQGAARLADRLLLQVPARPPASARRHSGRSGTLHGRLSTVAVWAHWPFGHNDRLGVSRDGL